MTPESGSPVVDDPDAGEPIRLLAGQEVETSSRFLGRVRGKIHRRTAVSQFAVYSWNLPRVVLMEIVGIVGHFVTAFGAGAERKRGRDQ